MPRIRFVDWLAGRKDASKQLAQIRASFGDYRRGRPRDPEKARLLRERGTPEHVIGPEATDLDEDEALRLAVEAQHESRRQLGAD
jgi:hypothetical protein